MKNNNFKEYIAPILVLVVICLVITGVLAVTYSVANPVIIKNTKEAADKARIELLPEADSFSKYEGKLVVEEPKKVFVEEVYVADNGAGYVMTVKTKSFGGILTEMVGIDKDGKITGVKVTQHADTPGLGTKAHDPAYLKQYVGVDNLVETSAKAESKKNPKLTYITGASVTSNAVHYGVYAALDQYKEMGGVK